MPSSLPGLTRFEQNGTQHFVSVALSQQAEVVFKDANELAVSIEWSGYKLLNLPARLYTVVCSGFGSRLRGRPSSAQNICASHGIKSIGFSF